MSGVLIIGKIWPEPASSAAGSRMMQLISWLKPHYIEFTFATAAGESPFMADLHSLGIQTSRVEVNNPDFDDFLKKLNPDVVIFDRFMTEEQFGWRVAEQCPDAIRILNTEDLHCLRESRRKAVRSGTVFSVQDVLAEETAFREIASIFRCDLSLIISEVEMEILTDLFSVPENLLLYLPLVYDSSGKLETMKNPLFEDRTGFISLGNFLHEPNSDAVFYLKEHIWPRILAKLPDAILRVYGAYPSPKIKNLHNVRDGFLVMGRAENALEVMQSARIHLAPLRFGAGLKGKLFDAMQAGTPSVTTAIGAEGMFNSDSAPGAIEETPEKFADAAVALYQDKKLWQQASENGFRILKNRFNAHQFETTLAERIAEIRNNFQTHRLLNFVGTMLRHHQHASTKYMSRWIEAKNRLKNQE